MLSDRQNQIFSSIVREYTTTAIPVSSSVLSRKYHPDISSATIRNEMAVLEELGFLLKPHTSSGRIPSDKGYRYFVDNFSDFEKLSQTDQKRLQVEFLKLKAQNTRLSRTLAKMLSTSSRCLALSGIVDKEEYYDFGMHNLLSDPDFKGLDEVSRISASLDLIDEKIERLLRNIDSDSPVIYIGEENPIEEMRQCSMIVSPYRTERGERGILAIIGPKRMRYGRNRNLIDFVKKFFGRGGSLILILILA